MKNINHVKEIPKSQITTNRKEALPEEAGKLNLEQTNGSTIHYW